MNYTVTLLILQLSSLLINIGYVKIMELLNLNTLSRFPFLNEATVYIKNLNLSLNDINESVAYRSAWERGKQRIKETLELGEIQNHGTTTDAENINELLSYVIARIITSAIADDYLVRRYSLAEAVYFYHGLQEKDLKFISDVALQFDLRPQNLHEDELELNITEFLRLSTSLRAPEYKLVNRDVHNGNVSLNKRELARLIQEAIRAKIQAELPIEIDQKLKENVISKITEIITILNSRKKRYEVQDLGKVSIIKFPPCMKHLLGMTQEGENVPHVGRFAIASFLHHIGLSSDQILTLFSSAPDFDVEKARYQIEHITGKISGTEYTPPSCDTMKSNSICFNPDSLCNRDWMNHPLTYYRVKGKKRKIEKDEKTSKAKRVEESEKDNELRSKFIRKN